MELTKDVLKELAKPFPPNRISIKVQTKPNENGNALCVAYIDARDVMDRLDEVVGGQWSDTYRNAPSGGLECALTICGVTRCDVGDDKNDNETEKAGYSDAFKRAAVKFGVGRFLYDLPKMFGKVKQVGKNFFLENGEEQRLQKVIESALSGKPVSNGNGNKPATRQEVTVTQKVEQSATDIHKEHAELWRQATKMNLLNKETVSMWSIKAGDNDEEVQGKVALIKAAIAEKAAK